MSARRFAFCRLLETETPRFTCRKSRLEPLEHRQLMTAATAVPFGHAMDESALIGRDWDPRERIPAPRPPVLTSFPNAAATVYLDFNGHHEDQWGSYQDVDTPVFDIDGNPWSFGAAEVARIEEIWRRVAEDFAPFNVNVTTVEPLVLAAGADSSAANGTALRVAIGGSSYDWYGHAAGGVGYVDSFTNPVSNVVYVFPQQLSHNSRYIAEAVSHESGHAFGLNHHHVYDEDGNQTAEYDPGTFERAPIMGVSYYADRGTWGRGRVASVRIPFFDRVFYVVQDDMEVIARNENGFGYRPDDHGEGFQSATPMNVISGSTAGTGQRSWTRVYASGIIATNEDRDFMSFHNPYDSAEVSLRVDVADVGANLDAKIELWRSFLLQPRHGGEPQLGYELVATADPDDDLGATITTQLQAGRYWVVVASHGTYGDVGQFTVTGTLVDQATPPIYTLDTLNAVRNGFGEPGGEGDINGDGSVNLDDLNLVGNRFGQILVADSQQAVIPPDSVSAYQSPWARSSRGAKSRLSVAAVDEVLAGRDEPLDRLLPFGFAGWRA